VKRAFAKINKKIYVRMQGPSEMAGERQGRAVGSDRGPAGDLSNFCGMQTPALSIHEFVMALLPIPENAAEDRGRETASPSLEAVSREPATRWSVPTSR
jgi:hypothetical protein